MRAWARGIILDVGHAGAFRRQCGPCCGNAGVLAGYLSTDIHTPPPERVVYDLLGVMSTFLALRNFRWPQSTGVTDKASRHWQKHRFGTLRVGSVGDAAVLNNTTGRFYLC